ncbi:13724_t:CDS:2, partial [Funneliformis geosporum]
MDHRQHFLTPYIIVLHAAKKANKSNKYAFANTKKEYARHIKSCQNITQKYNLQQIEKLLNNAVKDDAKLKLSKKRYYTKSSSSDESSVDDNNSMLEQNKNNNLEETLS